PIGDRLQFAQAWSYLYAQSFVAGVANFITIAIGGTLLLAIYASSRTQSGSLTKD
ncbi:MAG: ECF transporter S component, partial [Streptococcus salivarius]